MKVEWNGYRLTDNEIQALLTLKGGKLTGLQIGTGSVSELKDGLTQLQEKGLLFHSEEGDMVEKVISFVVCELGNASRCVLFETEEEEILAGLYCCRHMWVFLGRRRGVWQLYPLPELEAARTVFRQYAEQSGVQGAYYLYDGEIHILDSQTGTQEMMGTLENWARRNG